MAVDGGLGSEQRSIGSFDDSYRTSMTCWRSEMNGEAAAAATTQWHGTVLDEGKTQHGDLP
jgi:hypothetical protein